MICQKLNYSPINTYSLPLDWEFKFIGSEDFDPMSAVSCDNASDFAMIGLLNWQAEDMIQRLQCCVVRRGDGFSRQVKQHIARSSKKSEWPKYYCLFDSVTIRIGKNRDYYVYGTLKAHVDIINFSMFTFHPHELRATGGIAKWVLNDLRLLGMGIDDAICSVNRLLRVMGHLAFGYPIQLGYLETGGAGDSDGRSYAEMLVLAHNR